MSLICMVSKSPPALVVQTDAPWQTFDEFLAAARAAPGELIMANSGTGSIWHFNTLLMEQQAGIRVTHVPYPGTSGSLVSLLGGHVDAAVGGVGEVVSQIQAGRLRALAVFDEKRSAVLPGVPTTHELGKAFGTPAWSGFFGPAHMPGEPLSKLQQAFQKAFQSEEWAKLCRERGMEPVFLSQAEFQQFANEQAQFFSTEIPKLLRMER
jgi:tripartite-type tricarboxylate transporter receptor subunit TctC